MPTGHRGAFCVRADYQPCWRRIFAKQISPELLGWHDQSKIIARYFSVFSITTGKMSSLREISFNNREALGLLAASPFLQRASPSLPEAGSVSATPSAHARKHRLQICKLADRLLTTMPRYHFHKHTEQV